MDTGTRWRLAIAYAAFVSSNAGLSWLSATMARDGIAPAQVALLLAAHAAASTAAGILWSDVADRRRRRVEVLRWVATASAVSASGLLFARGPWPWAAALVCFGLVRGGVGPLLDAATLDMLGAERDTYGRLRLWGSGAFLALVLIAGELQSSLARGALALGQAALVVGAVAVTGLEEPRWGVHRLAVWRELLFDRRLGPMALVAFLHGVTLTTYDHLFTLLADARGFDAHFVGIALTVGVLTEIGVMTSAPWWLSRFGSRPALLAAVASGVPRWWLTATLTDPTAVAAVQVLHGVGFGAFWVAAVDLFARHAPEGRATSAQALLVVSTYGVGRIASMGVAAISLRQVPIDVHVAAMTWVSAAACTLLFLNHAGPVAPPR